MKFYVYIISGGILDKDKLSPSKHARLCLYEGCSENQAKYYTDTAISIMKYVKGTGQVNYFNADSKGVAYFKDGELLDRIS